VLGIFRKNLMEFIDFAHSQNGYHIVLYSLGLSALVIHQAVAIELYYNFVYSVRNHAPITSPDLISKKRNFHFKSVISRPHDLEAPQDGRLWKQKPKSILAVVKAMGNHRRALDQYRSVIVVDDQLNTVWRKEIPTFLNFKTTSFLWVTPTCFRMENGKVPVLVDADCVVIKRAVQEKRSQDFMFKRLQRMLTESQLDTSKSISVSIALPNTPTAWA